MPVVNQKASDLIDAAIHQITKHASPWRPALLLQLEQLKPIVQVHEMYEGTATQPPPALEHNVALPSMRDPAADDCDT